MNSDAPRDPVTGMEILDHEVCWDLLEHAEVGRLAVDVAGRPDIFPINFVVDDGPDGKSIVFRAAAGTKLAAAVLLHHIAFEIDGYHPNEREAWSVVVKGSAHQIDGMEELWDAEELPLFPWAAFPKPNFVRITPVEVTGRRFRVVDDVSPDSSIGWDPIHTHPDAVTPEPDAEYHPGAPKLRPD